MKLHSPGDIGDTVPLVITDEQQEEQIAKFERENELTKNCFTGCMGMILAFTAGLFLTFYGITTFEGRETSEPFSKDISLVCVGGVRNKENICPLQEGRNIAHFTGTAQKQSHKDELDNYMQEISFLRQSTLGDSNPQLKPLLETIINKFIFTRECRNDIRYLKCWCIYANICEDGLRVFSNLEERRIGQHYALFFECWARLLEQSGDYANARQVFEKGLKK
ncbi:putative Mad3/BUB1 homology region 1 [Blattamonas nauphoetae]|uniref:Mad3/BUB1 homology region 1 n=1 Tax=Blattamonas nauphoetae TaxID=2049346 RepID=A0ABQ9YLK6_9EUKA|nr:putative Mad3/BUB1 homology region 1 [Blattamonas nauphoetae]